MGITIQECKAYITFMKADGALTATDAARDAGISTRAMRSMIRKWLEDGVLEKSPTQPPLYRLHKDRPLEDVEEALEWFGLTD